MTDQTDSGRPNDPVKADPTQWQWTQPDKQCDNQLSQTDRQLMKSGKKKPSWADNDPVNGNDRPTQLSQPNGRPWTDPEDGRQLWWPDERKGQPNWQTDRRAGQRTTQWPDQPNDDETDDPDWPGKRTRRTQPVEDETVSQVMTNGQTDRPVDPDRPGPNWPMKKRRRGQRTIEEGQTDDEDQWQY